MGLRKTFGAAALTMLAVFGLSLGIATSATYVTSWGSQGRGPGQFELPASVAVDAHRHVYVADVLTNRIDKFTSGGRFLDKWGGRGSGRGQFNHP
jgi:hypothetical protein